MHWGEIKPLHIVQSDWMIDHEAEQTGSHEVPERNRNEEINRPLVGADSCAVRRAAGQSDILPRLNPTRTRGTTSRALKTEPKANTALGVPVK